MSVEEFSLFEYSSPRFKIDKPIRLIETFAGIGSQAKALQNLGANFAHHKVIEIDKYCIASYNAIHGTNFEPQDITKVHAADLEITDRDRYCYILTYSFPCQDISGSGLGRGLDKGSGTRSGLLWEIERILDECGENLPHVLLMENVPLLIGKKHIHNFQLWRRKLEKLGYSNFVQLLNAKDYGIPQNRNRCFMVSILGDYSYKFPPKQKLKLKLKDMLEDNVDEKYYLSDDMVKFFIANSEKQKELGNGFRFDPFERESSTLRDNEPHKDGQRFCERVKRMGVIDKYERVHQSQVVYSPEGTSPTLMARDYKDPIKINEDNGS